MKKEMTETRELILNALGEIARLLPEQRIGQIIFNYILRDVPSNDPFFIDDKSLLKLVERNLDEIKTLLRK